MHMMLWLYESSMTVDWWLTVQLSFDEVHPVDDFVLHGLDVIQQVKLPLLVQQEVGVRFLVTGHGVVFLLVLLFLLLYLKCTARLLLGRSQQLHTTLQLLTVTQHNVITDNK